MEKRLLNYQADKIEMVLAAHKAPARVWGGRLTPRTIQFHLAPAASTRLNKLEQLTPEVALALGASSVRLTQAHGTLSLEVPRPERSTVGLLDLAEQLHQDAGLARALAVPGTAILGLDSEGIPLLLRLASPDVAHVLIAGTTGSGKTELARTLLTSLVLHQRPHDLALALFDPKGRGLAPFAALPHLLFPVVQDTPTMVERLHYLAGEMERREQEGIERPRLVVVVDELADALQTGGVELEGLLTRLVQRGRSAGVAVVACTQKPTAKAVGSLLKANFPVRLVGRVASADDARVAAGIGGTGAEKLQGQGDFLLVAGGERIRFQAALVPAPQLARLASLPLQLPEPTESGLATRVRARLRRVK